MDKLQELKLKTTLNVHEAALLLASDKHSVHDAEMEISHAIHSGELAANIMRWATEQWDGTHLESNIDRMRTLVERADLDAWLKSKGRSI